MPARDIYIQTDRILKTTSLYSGGQKTCRSTRILILDFYTITVFSHVCYVNGKIQAVGVKFLKRKLEYECMLEGGQWEVKGISSGAISDFVKRVWGEPQKASVTLLSSKIVISAQEHFHMNLNQTPSALTFDVLTALNIKISVFWMWGHVVL